MPTVNRQVRLAARPVGFPKPTDFVLVESPVPTPGAGELLVRAAYLSLDPYMRGRMNERRSYAPSVGLGAVMVGEIVGRVVASNDPVFHAGDVVACRTGWQEYAIATAAQVRKVDPDAAPISTALGVLGMPGLTAYFGLLDVAHPQAGETVGRFVSPPCP